MQTIDNYQVIIISANWLSYQSKSEIFFDKFFKTVISLAAQDKLIILPGKAPVIST
jgi:hypothetical protein